jgi:hypothetical protein
MNSTDDTAGQPAENPEHADGARPTFAEFLGTANFEIIAEVPGRMPSGEAFATAAAALTVSSETTPKTTKTTKSPGQTRRRPRKTT